jgi:hypothetical protein
MKLIENGKCPAKVVHFEMPNRLAESFSSYCTSDGRPLPERVILQILARNNDALPGVAAVQPLFSVPDKRPREGGTAITAAVEAERFAFYYRINGSVVKFGPNLHDASA